MNAYKPLTGTRIIDLTRALAGPFCTALLADLGAEVIKVEPIGTGDATRLWPPYEDTNSLYFESTNRNKRSVCLDLRSDKGKEVLVTLIGEADVLVENFRPGVLAKMGLDSEKLKQAYPNLVIQSISGFGNTGPLKNYGGLDQIAQAMSGIMSVTGPDAEHTYRVGLPIVDILTGTFAAVSIAAALAGRSEHQKGVHMATSLLESAVAISVFQGQQALSLGHEPKPQGNDHPVIVPYGQYQTEDDKIIIAIAKNQHWLDLCEILGRPDLPKKPEYFDPTSRAKNREKLRVEMEAALIQHPASHWVDQIRNAGIPCGPVYGYRKVFSDPQVQALEMVQSLHRSDGTKIPLVRGPFNIDGQPTRVSSAPPALGEGTEEILAQFGFTKSAVEDLISNGIAQTQEQGKSSD